MAHRISVVLVFISASALLACGPTNRSNSGAAGNSPTDVARALFQHLPEPRLTDDGPPRLVVREGPAVPTPNQTEAPFPPPSAPDAGPPPATDDTFTVLGYSPHAEDELVGAVRVTFSEPMVPVATLSQQRTREAPLEITPATPGRFRWLGVETVVFEPEARRMPAATTYRVALREGVHSALGHGARAPFSFTFKTKALELVDSIPRNGDPSMSTTPVIALRFNQRVDAAALLEVIRFSGSGSPRLSLVSARDELEQLKAKWTAIGTWDEGYWIAVKPVAELPQSSRYGLSIPRGARAGEGPDPSTQAYNLSFTTRSPLAVTHAGCMTESGGWSTTCEANRTPTIVFNNELATEGVDFESLVHFTPAIEAWDFRAFGNTLHLPGSVQPATTYSVTLDAGIKDEHGQTLGQSYTFTVRTTDSLPARYMRTLGIATLERSSPHALPVQLLNTPSIEFRGGRIPFAQQLPTLANVHLGNYNTEAFDALLTRRTTVSTRGARNVLDSVSVDITPEIPEGEPGLAIFDMPVAHDGWTDNNYAFVQSTDLGMTSIVDAFGGAVRVTSLATGQPIPNVRIAVHNVSGNIGPPLTTALTDAQGVARFQHNFWNYALVAIQAELGEDRAFTLQNVMQIRELLVGAIYSDRDPYRPGDTVHLRMLARRKARNAAGTITSFARGTRLNCTVTDPHYAQFLSFEAELNEYGTATRDFVPPVGSPLGTWMVSCGSTNPSLTEGSIDATLRVEEYRAPEIEVHVTAPDGPHFQRDHVELTANAAYLFGAPAAGLPISWTLGREASDFAPPRHGDFTFGDHTNWLFGPGTLRVENRWGRDRATFGIDQAEADVIDSGNGVLAPDGSLRVNANLDPGTIRANATLGTSKYVLEAVVTDTSHQTVAGRVEVIAHPASVYTGVRMEKSSVREGEAIVSRHIVSNIDGQRQRGVAIRVRAFSRTTRLTPRNVGGQWVYEYQSQDREVGHCALTSTDAPVECRIAPQRAGHYIVEAAVSDSQHRTQITRTSVWVYGASFVPMSNDGVAEITPDKEEYEVGETAHLLVRVPFANARGLLARTHNGIVNTQPLDFNGNVQMVDVPITEADVPNLNVQIALQRGRASQAELNALLSDMNAEARAALTGDLGRPQLARGKIALGVKYTPKRLRVSVRPNHQTMEPGATLRVDINVRDSHNRGTDAEVSVIVVDESVLALLAYETPDPVVALHPGSSNVFEYASVFENIVERTNTRRVGVLRRGSADGSARAQAESAVMHQLLGGAGLGLLGTGRGGGGSGEGTIGLGSLGTIGHGAGLGGGSGRRSEEVVYERSPQPAGPRIRDAVAELAQSAPTSSRGLFATTAFFRSNVRTDQNGRAHVDIQMPDNLTTFRVMAIAVARDDRSGSGEAKVRVRKTVVLRPALPRFATYGDTFQAGVVVHNETGAATDFTVGIRAAGLVVENSGIERLRLAANESKLVSFPVRVNAAGAQARVQFAAATARGSDAADLTLPLVQPATGEAFATYGSLDSGAFRVPVVVPDHVIPHFGGLSLSLSSTALTGLDDAAKWLIDYPYLCAEQHASRLVAASALRTILGGGRVADGEAQANALALASISELQRMQARDGGFTYWNDSHETYLYVSTWVTYALLEAKRAGIEVPEPMLARALNFVARRARAPRERYGEDTAWSEQAFALYVLAEAEQAPEPEVLTRVHGHVRELPVFAKAWLDRALRHANANDPRAQALWTSIANGAVLTASGAHFAEERVESARLLWHSERRTDAIVLADLLNRAPQDPLVERTARSLAAARVGGHWLTTNETAWALSALVRYYRIAESVVPNTSVSAWLGRDFVGTTEFRGRSSAIVNTRMPMADLLTRAGNANDFVIAPTGEGRVYYRVGLRYAPTEFRLPPESQGFTVSRSYEPIDALDTVRRDDDGTWHIKLESNVRVRITIVVPDDRYDVAVDDPLPAGLEATNMAFATTATQALSGELDERRVDIDSFFAVWAFDHREMRDDRTVAFARHASAGVYELTYLARATTPGRFVATATHAEEMYAPETFGRGITEAVVIER